MPATSPTLSPTLSAMVAGFFGSSSSRPWTTLPDEVGADVGRLRVDAAADAPEHGHGRPAQPKSSDAVHHRGPLDTSLKCTR